MVKHKSARQEAGQWFRALKSELRDFLWTVFIYGLLLGAASYIAYCLLLLVIAEIKLAMGIG